MTNHHRFVACASLPPIMAPILPLIALALALTACSAKPGPAAPTGSASAAAESPPPAPPAPPAPAAAARKVSVSNDLYQFDYAYPAAAAAIPALKARLDADLDKQQADLATQARDAQKDAKANDFPFHAWSRSADWQVVTELPGWLSLSTIRGEFTGGAHPNYAFDTLLWDKAAGKARTATDLFTSQRALGDAVRKDFCAELDRQRLKKRGPDSQGSGIDEFNACIDPLEQTIILGSKGHKGFDRIGFLIAPYNAGPYAEGDYQVTLPVSPALLATVKPEYRAAFAAP
ncbi:PdaC/SigV domain-containing protein [Novosphingobium sp.]|uniref:PdaC/SigV domain-containing protein n=1 Tax=Novosphingobium sp. TaxID=1874826 RepID=UPI0038BA4BDD